MSRARQAFLDKFREITGVDPNLVAADSVRVDFLGSRPVLKYEGMVFLTTEQAVDLVKSGDVPQVQVGQS